MDNILHIEKVTRQGAAPVTIGHSESFSYGSVLTEDNENLGDTSSCVALGSPLRNQGKPLLEDDLPLVRSVEMSPFAREDGSGISEVIYLVDSASQLVPVSTKVFDTRGHGTRINHLPSLDYARSCILPHAPVVQDPRGALVEDLLRLNHGFERNRDHPLKEWIGTDLVNYLSRTTAVCTDFDILGSTLMVDAYVEQLRRTPAEFNERSLSEIKSIVVPNVADIPWQYKSNTALLTSLANAKARLVPNTYGLESLGTIPIANLPGILYNPPTMRDICNLADMVPVTDLNVDFVIDTAGNVVHYHEHIIANRYATDPSAFSDVRLSDVVDGFFSASVLIDVAKRIYKTNKTLGENVFHILNSQTLKFKVIKTINGEFAILIYAYDAKGDDLPLCGTYFDITLLSLAPMSVTAGSILF